jgi:adenosylcobinamide-GDP ribazoletransferase
MWLPYARTEGQGRLVAKRVGIQEVIIGTVMLLLVLILLPWQVALVALLVTNIVTLLSGSYFRARIQGITGDCLGATNQLTEVVLYLTAVILLRFSFLR